MYGTRGARCIYVNHRNTLLNEIVNVQKVVEPGHVLEQLHLGVRTRLRQGESTNQDGMDVVICMLQGLDGDRVQLSFSGAKRPLWYYADNRLQELKGDRKSIGGWQSEFRRVFQTHTLELHKGDNLYLSTDGFVDNPNKQRKKFGVDQFKQLLVAQAHLPMSAQKQGLLDALLNHQGETEQRDDITVLGIKL